MTDTDKARDELRSILDQDAYQIYHEDNRNFLEIWWNRLTDWIGEQLSKLFSGLEPSSGFAEIVLFVIMMAVLILIGVAVVRHVRHSRRGRGFTEYKPLQSLNKTKWTVADHLQAAWRQEATEHYTDAARHVFLALLLSFDEKGWLKAGKWKTNWEYAAELQQVNQQLADSFYQFASVFDRAVYGEQHLENDDYHRYRDEALKWIDEEPGDSSGNG
ncbi:DUF4129 domain-containing protein [Lentibacillus salinarum]|uniref:DUF4129 domain-containing protein n=1 Tax=Lentibacillus salinarum TaxID=446820 RepID=A0ABW3ZRH5_9BACI